MEVRNSMNEKILIVDDECAIADLVELYLKNDGYQVYKFYNATEALACVGQEDISLAILDIMLPDMDGFTLCKQIREQHLFPIIMLTAKVEDMDKITGLTLGADDYITKPFNPLELVARVKTQLRRYIRYNIQTQTVDGQAVGDLNSIQMGLSKETASAAMQEQQELDVRGLYISKKSHKCTLNGKELALTPLEFNILWYLCEQKGRVVSSEQLFETVWGEKYLNNNNTVMAHIARIRDKMHEPARKPKFIKTVWGVGYTIEE